MIVKKACICCVIDARPGNIPDLYAKKSNKNWPAKRNRPIRMSRCSAIRGRGTNMIGREAIRNRSAVSCDALKLSRPNVVAPNANPQITEVRTASAISLPSIEPPYLTVERL
jgi:hypothetical protein